MSNRYGRVGLFVRWLNSDQGSRPDIIGNLHVMQLDRKHPTPKWEGDQPCGPLADELFCLQFRKKWSSVANGNSWGYVGRTNPFPKHHHRKSAGALANPCEMCGRALAMPKT